MTVHNGLPDRVGIVAVVICACVLGGTPAFPQGVLTGGVSGQVKSSDGIGVPGVMVTAESENLQGRRRVVTSSDGHYIVPFLPPGEYTISFELAGFQSTKERTRIAMSQAVTVSVTLGVAPVAQTITVDAGAPGDFPLNLRPVSSYKQGDLVEQLPLDRTLTGTVLLGPGVQSTGPGGNLAISGAASYESLFLVNGVVVNDNQTGQPNPLFIEDAIQETATTTAAISAEYGRFSGGVVNAITKSGGNQFSGGFRATLTNDAWTALTPFPGDARVDNRVPTYEMTLGGRIVTDKLWFFAAGRHADPRNAATTSLTKIPYVFENDENRYEGKLTYSFTPSHMFKASATKSDLSQYNRASGTFLDLASLSDRTNPQRLLSANYTGVLGPSFFLETQWSQRTYALVGSGAKFTDLLNGTILFDRQVSNARYHAPSSCGVCTSEHRDNYDGQAKATYFISTGRTGSHDLVSGVDLFNDRRYDNQFPSASNYSIYGTSAIFSGATVDPVFNNDGTTFIRWTSNFTSTQGTNFRTYSGFGNDRWRVSERLRVNVGLRYDKNGGTDSVGNPVVRDSAWSPRLGLSWDPRGDGIWTVNAGAAKYVAGILVTVADSSSPGGRAATFDYTYQGPAINAIPGAANLLGQNDAIQTVFDWFKANGGTSRPIRGTPSLPGVSSVIGGSLGSPDVVEWTLGVARRLGTRDAFRTDTTSDWKSVV
jgi:outer membrane receptor protein involved in Fe transport